MASTGRNPTLALDEKHQSGYASSGKYDDWLLEPFDMSDPSIWTNANGETFSFLSGRQRPRKTTFALTALGRFLHHGSRRVDLSEHARHDPVSACTCNPDGDDPRQIACRGCGVRDCPDVDPNHYAKTGCPSCSRPPPLLECYTCSDPNACDPDNLHCVNRNREDIKIEPNLHFSVTAPPPVTLSRISRLDHVQGR